MSDDDLPPILREVIAAAAGDRFDEACAYAWRTATRTASGEDEWDDDLEQVLFDLGWELWEVRRERLSVEERLALTRSLYARAPAWTFLSHAFQHYRELSEEGRKGFWHWYRDLLEQPDDRLAEPVLYSLWVDFFEVEDKDAWREVTAYGSGWERRVERVVRVSGPVPWKDKAPLYARLIDVEGAVDAVREGLARSASDVYGRIDEREAADLLARISRRR